MSKCRVGIVLIALCLGACAPAVVQQPTQLTPGVGKSFRLTRETDPNLSVGSAKTLRAGTRWELVGTIAQGEVYRTRDQVVTVKSDHVHEGYIVVRQGALVGFYLPVERTFSPLTEGQPLSVEP